MIATKVNQEITEYQEKFFMGLSLRQLACFAAAIVLAVVTSLAGVYWLHWSMDTISYLIMAEVLPFMGLGFVRHNGYPFEILVRIIWKWHFQNHHIPFIPKMEEQNAKQKSSRRTSGRGECLYAFQTGKAQIKEREKATRKSLEKAEKEYREEKRAQRKAARSRK